VRTDTLVLPNCDLDSGNPTQATEYSLTDDSYAKLLAQLSRAEIRIGAAIAFWLVLDGRL
jgi:hypothetical protein